jgi:hypothetical protein
MITIFECTADECPNQGVVYRMEDANPTAMCGGCKKTLIGIIEQEEAN